jgi:hypothetical protein
VLFIMIGLELLRLEFEPTYAWAGALAIPALLAARFLSVGLAALVPGLRQEFPPYVVAILTWGGLRGGISGTLALALPSGGFRDASLPSPTWWCSSRSWCRGSRFRRCCAGVPPRVPACYATTPATNLTSSSSTRCRSIFSSG